MNIVLLASNPTLYSNKRIIEAAESRGHTIRFINIQKCFMNICAKKPMIYYNNDESISDVDAVIPRIKPRLTFYGCALLRQFHTMMKAFCLNEPIAISRSRDKLRSLQLLAQKKVNIPTTGFAHDPENTQALIRAVGGAPLVIKLLEGTQGKGVVLAESNVAADSVIQAFRTLDAHILVQEFIKESAGRDLRCLVIGNKVVAAMERASSTGDFRANLHLGGVAQPTKMTTEEKQMALKATKIMGLHVAGVDILRSNSGPKILEINSSPGLEGIEGATGQDVAGMMIEYIEKMVVKPRKGITQ